MRVVKGSTCWSRKAVRAERLRFIHATCGYCSAPGEWLGVLQEAYKYTRTAMKLPYSSHNAFSLIMCQMLPCRRWQRVGTGEEE